jgi:hypothetical protein
MQLFSPMQRIQIGGKKVAFGMNQPFKWNYMPSLHAEIDAFSKIKNYKNIGKKLDLFVIRITKGGNLAESRPCFHCIDILSKSKLNICNVYYSTSSGTIVCESFKNLVANSNINISKGFTRHRY